MQQSGNAPAATVGGTTPRRTRILYAANGFGSEAVLRSRDVWLLYSYAPPADSGLPQLLPLGVMGLLLAGLQVVGALDDAIVGWWSDRTTSRLGRRLPFILAGTPLWLIFAVLVMAPPTNVGAATVAIYFTITMEGFNLFSSVAGGPYEALFPDLARTSEERVSLVSKRVLFGVCGAAFGLIVSGPLVAAVGIPTMMIVMAGLAFGARLLGVLGVWKVAPRDQPPARIPLREALTTTLRNGQFLTFLPTVVLFQSALVMLVGAFPYYAGAILRVREPGLWVSIMTAVAIAAMLLGIPLFSRIAHRRGKSDAYRAAMLGCACTFPLLALAGLLPGVPVLAQVLVTMVLIGLPQAGVYLFPIALTADIADDDAAQTGMRREATYFGMQSFVERTTGALAPLLLAGLLALGNTMDNPLGVRLVGPGAALLVLASFFIFRRYTLPDEPRIRQTGEELNPSRPGPIVS